MANRGYFIDPNLVLEIDGEKLSRPNKNYVDIDRGHFDYVVEAMEEVVVSGSARRAYMKELEICGKTSTVQNPHGYDHSGFIGFAPKNEPKIAIAAYIENSGWGGRSAASIASLAAEKYIFFLDSFFCFNLTRFSKMFISVLLLLTFVSLFSKYLEINLSFTFEVMFFIFN